MNATSLWSRFQQHFIRCPEIGFSLDASRMNFPADFFGRMAPAAEKALQDMQALENGAIANPDENRMVGHYWLRAPQLAPSPEIREAITSTRQAILDFAAKIHRREITGSTGAPITDLLLIGIGGSALGPQLVADALGNPGDPIRIHFFDNTDPDGMARVLAQLKGRLPATLVAVISKSGGTKESRNGMLIAQQAFKAAGLHYPAHFVAVTGEGSELDRTAQTEGWLQRFPMWDWVGGRTSVMSAVGLLPMALQGLDTDAFLRGAAEMDIITRTPSPTKNPAMLLALAWHHAGGGRGAKDMVILPYKDRLLLFSRYLQQLVMESLGKELDLQGRTVHQGIAVYGNKGSTDQHAFVQQLRDGLDNFFVTFIEVLDAGEGDELEVEPGIRCGDYLQGFLRGTRKALTEKNRESLTLTVETFNAFSLGALIALFERAVGFYASLVGINAYHQPGVEAGKKAAAEVLRLQAHCLEALQKSAAPLTAAQIAETLSADPEDVFHVLTHLALNRSQVRRTLGDGPAQDTFSWVSNPAA